MPPAIPTMASLLLALLWVLSVFGGWGVEAFCPAADSPGTCADRIASAAVVSGVIALFAAVSTAAAWFTRRQGLLGVAVIAWVVAVGALFVGGVIAQ
ncbi:hypothetical protein [Planotetraspora mira]|uniref:Uncharacterized protein n=1 Tax=Planotetraspora mira TaxID=58121 RepID=A0A8J3TPX4_9ACTN|nr:hypothetical protein [Planotetraspora mira]GII29232.1 hypothetical protein Pmi06nite_26740 [Planotetraspora mira]